MSFDQAASRHNELRRIFGLAIESPPSERAALIARECGDDRDLHSRVEALLAAAGEDTGFFASPTHGGQQPARASVFAEHPQELPGSRIGPYKLLQLIGEGGFGSVFLAEQERPMQRKVALKIIKLGMDTKQVVARFEQERQALALMDHPNIAKVLDAGATDVGRPYFVMELVRGVPLTEYCDQARLTARERLELFVPICLAVQHAHQKGVIHRDIKPSNILVTMHDGVPVPKVIDFGIAKATNARLTERTLFTEHRQLIGTPAYMSPEQAEMSGLDIDTRSDIYSLGVLLYELLTGTTPFDTRALMAAGFGEIQRIIREVDPPKPSTRIGTLGDTAGSIAAHRRTEPSRLGALVRGDLDWIVMKALEKDRTRRYESASSFAADVLRHLGGEPVEAAPPSASYRFRKFIRRRKGLVLSLAAVGLTLTLGLVGTSIGLVRAHHASLSEAAALNSESAARRRAEATTRFLQDMITSIDPEKAQGRDLTVKELVDDAASKLGSAFVDQPEAEATLRHTLGESYNQLGRLEEAHAQFLRAAEIRARTLGPEHRDTLADRYGVGGTLLQLGQVEKAKPILEETYAAQKRTLGANDPDTLATASLVGFALQLSEEEEQALEIYRTTLAGQAASLGQGHKATLETMGSIADVLQDLGRLEEAEKAARDFLSAAIRAQGDLGAQKLMAESILVSILNDLGRSREAEPLARNVYAGKLTLFGPNHHQVYVTMNVLATTLENLGQHAEAVEILRKAADGAARDLGADHTATLAYQSNLARNLQLDGKLDEAESIFRAVLEVRKRVSGENATPTLAVMNNLGLLLLARERPVDAEAILRPMEELIANAVPDTHWMRGQAKVNLARSLAGQSKFEEAEQFFLDGYERLARALPEGHERRVLATKAITSMYEKWQKPEQVAAWKDRR